MIQDLAMITGATSGIGESTSRLFAQKGIPLILTGRNQQKLLLLQSELSALVQVEILAGDLGDSLFRNQLIDLLRERKPNLCINNAGYGLYGEAIQLSTKDQLDVLEVNGKALLELTLEMAKMLSASNQKGIVLNVSSVVAFVPFPLGSVYGASKAFVNQLSLALDFELKDKGIRVLALCPGVVETGFRERAGGKHHDFEAIQAMTPDFIALEIWSQIHTGNALLITNWKYRLLRYLAVILPNRWVAAIEMKAIKNLLDTTKDITDNL